MTITEQELKDIQQEHHWSDDDAERFKEFLETYSHIFREGWCAASIADAVAILNNEIEAFWFIYEGHDFADIASYLSTYDLSNLKEGNTTLAKHIVEEHEHYYKVKNGYVFFSEGTS